MMTTTIQPLDFEALLVRSGVLKRCTKCGEAKPLAKFSRMTRTKDGRRPSCKACCKHEQYAYGKANAERIAERHRAYRQANAGRRRADHARRRAELLGRLAAWADLEAVAEVYAACPDGFDVDHVVPFTGKHNGAAVVCGLHVAENLQHLAPTENKRKNNRFAPAWEVLSPDLLQGGRRG